MATPEIVTRQEFALATVAFLERTHTFYQYAILAGVVDSSFPHATRTLQAAPTAGEKYSQATKDEMLRSQGEINACIQALGGLPLTVTIAGSSPLRCIGETWHGYDPDPEQAGNLLWHIKGTPPGHTMSLAPAVIGELREEFGQAS
jgi:hypothetical protein